MKISTAKKISELIQRYPALEICRADLNLAVEKICESFRHGNKILVCGNGGSASDSLHIVGELMKGFTLPRQLENFNKNFVERAEKIFPNDVDYFKKNLQCALPAISLIGETALNTAVANDNAADLIFAQQVLGLGKRGDILLAISTSGNSQNALYAAEVAKVLELEIISLTGRRGGKLKNISDVTICVPATETFMIQELHLPIYHAICIAVENEFFG